MKKEIFLYGGLVVAAGIAYFLYRKYREPRITLNQIDWQNNTAAMTIDGNVVRINGTEGFSLGRGYTVEMEQGFRTDLNTTGPVNVVLKKDGSVRKVISYYPQ